MLPERLSRRLTADSHCPSSGESRLQWWCRSARKYYVRTARRFDLRAWLLAGRLPWLAFLIFRVGLAIAGDSLSCRVAVEVFHSWTFRKHVSLPPPVRRVKMGGPMPRQQPVQSVCAAAGVNAASRSSLLDALFRGGHGHLCPDGAVRRSDRPSAPESALLGGVLPRRLDPAVAPGDGRASTR